MAEVPDKRFIHALVEHAAEHIVHRGGLIIGNDARQHRDGYSPLLCKRAEQVELLRHKSEGNIEVLGLERGKLR